MVHVLCCQMKCFSFHEDIRETGNSSTEFTGRTALQTHKAIKSLWFSLKLLTNEWGLLSWQWASFLPSMVQKLAKCLFSPLPKNVLRYRGLQATLLTAKIQLSLISLASCFTTSPLWSSPSIENCLWGLPEFAVTFLIVGIDVLYVLDWKAPWGKIFVSLWFNELN